MTKSTEYTCQVLIIGAGPAGSTLAYLLAQAGIRVILLDKKKFPRNKVCAGGLPHNVINLLPFDISSVIEEEIYSVNLTCKLKNGFVRSYSKPLIYTVNRDAFDYLLVSHAKKLGTEFFDSQEITNLIFDDNKWIATTADRIIKADLLVGADGANSFIAKRLSLRPYDYLHIGLQVEVPVGLIKHEMYSQKTIALDWGTLKDSYAWIFPKKDIVSIGVKGPAELGVQLRLYLKDFLGNYEIQIEDYHLIGHVIPHRVSKLPISAQRAVLVGDAAGLVDYWTGEGISYAIRSAQIAAQEIKKFFNETQASLTGYEQAINQKLLPMIKVSYQFSKIFNYCSFIALYLIQKYDYPWDVFCRVMRGDRTFSEVKQRFRPDIIFRKILFKHRRG